MCEFLNIPLTCFVLVPFRWWIVWSCSWSPVPAQSGALLAMATLVVLNYPDSSLYLVFFPFVPIPATVVSWHGCMCLLCEQSSHFSAIFWAIEGLRNTVAFPINWVPPISRNAQKQCRKVCITMWTNNLMFEIHKVSATPETRLKSACILKFGGWILVV